MKLRQAKKVMDQWKRNPNCKEPLLTAYRKSTWERAFDRYYRSRDWMHGFVASELKIKD